MARRNHEIFFLWLVFNAQNEKLFFTFNKRDFQLSDPLPEDRFIRLFNKNIQLFKQRKLNK